MIKSSKHVIFLFSFLMTVNFYTPVFASFLKLEHGFNESQITFLFVIFSLSVFIFEIPTGIISDKIGERKSLIIGSALTGISTFLFIIGNTTLIYIGQIALGLGNTFYSGSFESLVYQYCKSPDNKFDYSAIVSKTYSLRWIALCFSYIVCFFYQRVKTTCFHL